MSKAKNNFKCTTAWVIAVQLFAVVSSFIICASYASNEAYLRECEEACRTIPVDVTVQGVTGENGRESAISSWTVDLFTGKNSVEIIDKSSENRETILISLSGYLKDVRIKMSRIITRINGLPALDQTTFENPSLIGITSILADEQLLPENGCEITWLEGYDESVLGGEELVCLVPAGKAEAYDNGNGETVPYFYYAWGRTENGAYVEVSRHEYECTLKIVGTYTAGDEVSVYCPFSIIEQVYAGLDEIPSLDSISATIADNSCLAEFCEKASFFYSNLSENAIEISNGLRVINRSKTYTFDNSFNALIIDDSDLINLMSELEAHNAKFNRIINVLIVVLSAVMGLIAGYLMIQFRKPHNTLLYLNGKSNTKAYFSFVLEQIICIALGIALGGAYYLWKPIEKLLIFAVVYFAVFTIVILLFIVIKLVKKTKINNIV